MQKVYLLLRSNQQTGPYSLEELIKFDLKPHDLIWIEGKSAGWYYPQEIKALQPHLSFVKQVPAGQAAKTSQPSSEKTVEFSRPKTVFVSMPSGASKEQIPPPPLSATVPAIETTAPKLSASSFSNGAAEEVKTSYSKDLQDVETDYMNWVYQKKTKKKSVVSVRGAIAACLVVGLAFAAWWVMKPSYEATKNVSAEQTSFSPVQSELAVDSAVQNETATPGNKTSSSKKEKKNRPIVATSKTPIVENPQPVKKQVQGAVINTNSTESHEYEPAPVVKEESKTAPEENKEPVITEAPKEKKKLRDKIFDLFKKKPAENKEDAKPVEEEAGKRNSTRREAGSNLAQMVAVKFTIPNEWMMGIKGAKATLTNRSSETVANAVIEVAYYNDDNDVVDKRTISFTDIRSKQTKTVAVPDHPTATRLEYNVISAVGANEPFAKR